MSEFAFLGPRVADCVLQAVVLFIYMHMSIVYRALNYVLHVLAVLQILTRRIDKLDQQLDRRSSITNFPQSEFRRRRD